MCNRGREDVVMAQMLKMSTTKHFYGTIYCIVVSIALPLHHERGMKRIRNSKFLIKNPIIDKQCKLKEGI